MVTALDKHSNSAAKVRALLYLEVHRAGQECHHQYCKWDSRIKQT